ncbi:MAG: imidazole glycerol phosphate synthase subunit HisH [Clostridiales bacterium]|jgi:glutamine amidotransferase|nr:imidazole glycerol phosphate synthase subunit HisH [Clostridiales bacterium]HOK82364.1 imidazole glycerol phosphate synthase subunit HisH [Clostridia bacterium]HOL61478.1 imidazole glycerol phosphate synthase subunit HisH [Clostridia bacterium]HPO54108.1 imidazole glycerol phosphate synthase subunit HisH [Clostridia bacterium]
MIAVVDYGVGNLFSLTASLKHLGLENKVTADEKEIKKASHIILPGVGAFADAYKKLEESGLADLIKEEAAAGKPLLGICLGMQMLFDKSYEYGEHKGLGLIKGEICPIKDDLKEPLKVPHMGWNALKIVRESPLLKYTKEGEFVYFVHSYYAKNCPEAVIATSEYEIDITAAVDRGNVFGTQFHPEKSGEVGLKMLKAFAEAGR